MFENANTFVLGKWINSTIWISSRGLIIFQQKLVHSFIASLIPYHLRSVAPILSPMPTAGGPGHTPAIYNIGISLNYKKLSVTGTLWEESDGDHWIPLTEGQ